MFDIRCEIGAAIAIQAWFKGILARKHVENLRKALNMKVKRAKEQKEAIEKIKS